MALCQSAGHHSARGPEDGVSSKGVQGDWAIMVPTMSEMNIPSVGLLSPVSNLFVACPESMFHDAGVVCIC